MICSSLFSAISKQVFVWFVLPCFEQSASEFSSDLFFLVFSKQVYVFLKRWFFEQNLVIIVMLSFWWFQDFLFFWIGSILGSNALTRDVDLTFFFFFFFFAKNTSFDWFLVGSRLLVPSFDCFLAGFEWGSPFGCHFEWGFFVPIWGSPFGCQFVSGFFVPLWVPSFDWFLVGSRSNGRHLLGALVDAKG